MSYKFILDSAERLGISHSSSVQKAESFLRVLNNKHSSKSINDVAKVVLCLDLAASILGEHFDKETALKLSGLKKTLYQNNLNNIEKILNLDRTKTVTELCVQLSCTEAKETAEKLLTFYKGTDKKITDFNHPQYVSAAVFTSCKIHGLKVDKNQLKIFSRLKVSDWNELIGEFCKFADGLGLFLQKKENGKKNVCPLDHEDLYDNNSKFGISKADLRKAEVHTIEEYDVWRERMLKEATSEILNNEMKF